MTAASIFSKEKNEVSLLLHIGSGSIGGALIVHRPNEIPAILYTVRESIVLKKSADHGREFSIMKTSLDRVIERLSAGARSKYSFSKRLSGIMCILSSPWYVSQTKIVSLEHKEPVHITKDFIDSIVQKEITAFKKELNAKNSDSKSPNENILIESHVIHIKLNGYSVEAPIGKKAETIEIAMIMSFAPQGIIRAAEDSIKKIPHANNVTFHTFSLAGFAVVHEVFPETKNFIFTEVGGEVTDVAIAKKGILLETISLPIGSYTLVRSISESLNVLPDIALSYLSMEESGAAHQELQANIMTGREKAKDTWLKAFGNALAVFSEEIFLPRELFLISEQGTGNFFLDLIKKNEFKEIAFTSGSVHTMLLSGHTLSDFVAYDAGVPRDSFISLIALFHATIHRL